MNSNSQRINELEKKLLESEELIADLMSKYIELQNEINLMKGLRNSY